MPSPFPGMNPFLERDDVWPDLHHRLIDRMADALADQVDPRYLVKIEEHLYVQDAPELAHRAGPRADVEYQAYLEVRDRSSRELVTVLELLSPTNKGRHRDQYLRKRDQVLVSTAHLVEIDLLRGGDPMPAPDRPGCDYSATVSRAEQRPEADFWPILLRERLPVIPVPLRAPDRDATLDLQELLHRVYDAGRYAHHVYEGQPQPPLRPDEEAWARGFLPAPQ